MANKKRPAKAKAVEAEVVSSSTAKSTSNIKSSVTRDQRSTRSPFKNLIIGIIAGFVYALLFGASFLMALGYGLALFMLFNTIDYCFLYYRLNKEKEK